MSTPEDKKLALDGQEKPVLDGVANEGPVTQDPQERLANLQNTLESHGITSPDDFSGLLQQLEQYKRSYGSSQNEVGELRRQIRQLRDQMQTRQQPESNDWEEATPVPLRNELKEVLREFVIELNQENQKAWDIYNQERAKVESKPNWANVQPYFDKAMQIPKIAQALQTRAMTMTELYSDINEKLLMSEVKSVIDQIPRGEIKTRTPEADTTGRITQPLPVDVEKKERIKTAKERQDAQGVLDAIFDKNDAFFR